MAIENYATLADTIKTYAARSDTKFSNQIETFIALAEDRIYNGSGDEGDPTYSKAVRVKELKHSDTIAMTSGSGTLPTDAIDIRAIRRSGDKIGLDYLPPEKFAIEEAHALGGNPAYYTIEGETLKVYPSYTGDLTCLYWRRLTALTAADNSNDLLINHPMLYLTACLFEAFTFTRDPDMALNWLARYRGIAAGANASAEGLRRGGGRTRITPRVPLP